jgi:hypothetical protein
MSEDQLFNISEKKFKFALKFQGYKWMVPGPSFVVSDNGHVGQFISSLWCNIVIPKQHCGIQMCVVSIPSHANSRDAYNALENGDAEILTSVELTEEELEYAKGFLLQKLSEKKEKYVSKYIGNEKLSIKITACQEDQDVIFTLCCPGFNL